MKSIEQVNQFKSTQISVFKNKNCLNTNYTKKEEMLSSINSSSSSLNSQNKIFSLTKNKETSIQASISNRDVRDKNTNYFFDNNYDSTKKIGSFVREDFLKIVESVQRSPSHNLNDSYGGNTIEVKRQYEDLCKKPYPNKSSLKKVDSPTNKKSYKIMFNGLEIKNESSNEEANPKKSNNNNADTHTNKDIISHAKIKSPIPTSSPYLDFKIVYKRSPRENNTSPKKYNKLILKKSAININDNKLTAPLKNLDALMKDDVSTTVEFSPFSVNNADCQRNFFKEYQDQYDAYTKKSPLKNSALNSIENYNTDNYIEKKGTDRSKNSHGNPISISSKNKKYYFVDSQSFVSVDVESSFAEIENKKRDINNNISNSSFNVIITSNENNQEKINQTFKFSQNNINNNSSISSSSVNNNSKYLDSSNTSKLDSANKIYDRPSSQNLIIEVPNNLEQLCQKNEELKKKQNSNAIILTEGTRSSSIFNNQSSSCIKNSDFELKCSKPKKSSLFKNNQEPNNLINDDKSFDNVCNKEVDNNRNISSIDNTKLHPNNVNNNKNNACNLKKDIISNKNINNDKIKVRTVSIKNFDNNKNDSSCACFIF